jgi:TPR repeat protein
MREDEQGLRHKCPFCREPLPKTEEEMEQNCEKRIKTNDPVALYLMGSKRDRKGDFGRATEYYKKAAKLGNIEAHYNLSFLYRKGLGVEKDMKKELYHLEEAAIGGHPDAMCNLGYYEWNNGRYDRAVNHYIIAAKLGLDRGMETVKKGFMRGLVSKEHYSAALRGHQAAVDATKSKQRDAAEKAIQEDYSIKGNPAERSRFDATTTVLQPRQRDTESEGLYTLYNSI